MPVGKYSPSTLRVSDGFCWHAMLRYFKYSVGDGGVAAVVHRDGYAEENLVREMRRLQSLHETLYRLFYASVLQQYVSAYHVYLASVAVGVFERLVETLERLLHMSEQRKRERTALVHLSRA